ncbi:diaminopimelate decarboxylase [Apilactobacillus timberlakei]|uniref:diaminopimelate decarboxylase n=1 Tax=Apilactobacillus timberlakei TaxID=2008380 RepID=UPI00112EDD58|nr:diaminopimelate decarboxylase [Apilactobacillus timberlakei]TPR18794.1 diaminopimelate decarboxylase [Apilactobacillus timberlakei]TPR21041.1 diaminopimelate decarboxylase [Apilactobacillus timberlakei]TPR23692.1 diaminopimelate decarboxylase [Apilactobacillus timberlakei]
MTKQITKQNINEAGHLEIGGCDAIDLANQFGTPLVVYDTSKIRSQIRKFKAVFEKSNIDYAVCYASKSFANTAMYQLVNQEQGHIDVVSGGELSMALHAGFPASRISFHGNNKSEDELRMALENHVGVIMLDNFHEIDLLNQLLTDMNTHCDVMLRITPGISAHTHEFIQTGQTDSKFGFDLESGEAKKAFEIVHANKSIHLLGIHAHIGSQVFELKGFEMAASKLVDLASEWKQEYGYEAQVINVGGGFGIQYTDEDDPLRPEAFVQKIVDTVKARTKVEGLKMPAIWIEPGRSIVGNAGYNLYRIGSRKDVPGIKSYVSVDGGMGDNIRPMLYDAKYEAVMADHPLRSAVENVHLVGKYCESGDVLIKNQPLPETKPGDVIVMLDTGAYGYSMASNYNLNPKPAIVFVENGKAQLVTRRQNYTDLYELDNQLK